MTRLKDRTLKKAYERQTLREGTTLLLEADQKVIQQIEQALAALSGITPDGAKIFETAIDAAKQELGKYLQGGIKQTFKNVFSDPVAKATTLANAIRTGLSQLPTIARLYLPKGGENETQKSIWEMVPPEKQKDLLASFTKAFKSDLSKGGLGGAMDLLKGNGLPYITNLQQAVQELLQNTNPQGGFKMGQQAAAQQEPPVQTATPETAPGQAQPAPGQAGQGPQGAQAGAQGTPQAPGPKTSNAVQTQGPQVAQTTQPAQPAQQSQPASKPVSTGTPKKLTVNDTDQMGDIADFLTNPKRKNSPKIAVDPKSVQQVLAALAKNGMLFA
jgi:hypothetical protein